MLPPGLAVVAVSPKAWRQIDAHPAAGVLFQSEALSPDAAAKPPGRRPSRWSSGWPKTCGRFAPIGIEHDLGRAASCWPRPRGRGWRRWAWQLFAERPAAGLTAVRTPAGHRNGQAAGPAGAAVRHQAGQRAGQAERADFSHRAFWRDRPARHSGDSGRAGAGAGRLGHRVTLGSAVAAAGRVLRAAQPTAGKD